MTQIVLPAEPLHVVFRRLLAAQPNRLASWQRTWIDMALDRLEWAIGEEVASLLGAWPTSEVMRALKQVNPRRLAYMELVILAFWLGMRSDEIGNMMVAQEIQELADRLWVRQVIWESDQIPVLNWTGDIRNGDQI